MWKCYCLILYHALALPMQTMVSSQTDLLWRIVVG